LAEIFEKPPEVKGRYEPLGKAKLLDHDAQSLHLRAGVAIVEVTALAPDLFRVGMFPKGRTPDYNSEAVAKEDWEPLTAEIREEDAVLTLSTGSTTVCVGLDPLRISFVDYSGARFAADDQELGMGVVEQPGADVFSAPLGNPVRLYKRREDGERYFGCGERPHRLLQQYLRFDPVRAFDAWRRSQG
jgi:alpha-glucosidase